MKVRPSAKKICDNNKPYQPLEVNNELLNETGTNQIAKS